MSRLRPKTVFQVSSQFLMVLILNIIFINLELLCKDKDERISIKDTLDHPWFVKGNGDI